MSTAILLITLCVCFVIAFIAAWIEPTFEYEE
jgi:hypothetical protein